MKTIQHIFVLASFFALVSCGEASTENAVAAEHECSEQCTEGTHTCGEHCKCGDECTCSEGATCSAKCDIKEDES